MPDLYDRIGINYAELRQPDPRIATHIHTALGDAKTILNVGAGTGSYEPRNRNLVAVEPSLEMIRKRLPGAAPVVRACADSLPFKDCHFDAAMAALTLHHWPDKEAGLHELRRVTSGNLILLTFDPSQRPWLQDYLPELIALDESQMPTMSDYQRWLGPVQVSSVPIPHDCTDGFLYAYWRRPHAYLDARVRSGSSAFWDLKHLDEGLRRLEDDLSSGEWAQRYGRLLDQDEYDAGYRLITAA